MSPKNLAIIAAVIAALALIGWYLRDVDNTSADSTDTCYEAVAGESDAQYYNDFVYRVAGGEGEWQSFDPPFWTRGVGESRRVEPDWEFGLERSDEFLIPGRKVEGTQTWEFEDSGGSVFTLTVSEASCEAEVEVETAPTPTLTSTPTSIPEQESEPAPTPTSTSTPSPSSEPIYAPIAPDSWSDSFEARCKRANWAARFDTCAVVHPVEGAVPSMWGSTYRQERERSEVRKVVPTPTPTPTVSASIPVVVVVPTPTSTPAVVCYTVTSSEINPDAAWTSTLQRKVNGVWVGILSNKEDGGERTLEVFSIPELRIHVPQRTPPDIDIPDRSGVHQGPDGGPNDPTDDYKFTITKTPC